jgi:hypothetical protein
MATSKIKKPETYLKASDFVVERKSSEKFNIGANATYEIPTWSVAKSGYKVLRVVGFYSGAQVFTVSQIRVNPDTNMITFVVHNTQSTAYTDRTANVDILYVRNV